MFRALNSVTGFCVLQTISEDAVLSSSSTSILPWHWPRYIVNTSAAAFHVSIIGNYRKKLSDEVYNSGKDDFSSWSYKTANIVQPHAPCMHTWVSVIAVLYQNAVLTMAILNNTSREPASRVPGLLIIGMAKWTDKPIDFTLNLVDRWTCLEQNFIGLDAGQAQSTVIAANISSKLAAFSRLTGQQCWQWFRWIRQSIEFNLTVITTQSKLRMNNRDVAQSLSSRKNNAPQYSQRDVIAPQSYKTMWSVFDTLLPMSIIPVSIYNWRMFLNFLSLCLLLSILRRSLVCWGVSFARALQLYAFRCCLRFSIIDSIIHTQLHINTYFRIKSQALPIWTTKWHSGTGKSTVHG